MPDLPEIKALIKAVLASSQVQLTIRDLQRDFHCFSGYHIPYFYFGFENCENFLRTINDTCMVHGKGNNAAVIPILSSSSEHIVDMIAKQKDMKKLKRRRPKNIAIIVPTMPKHQQQLVSQTKHVQQEVNLPSSCVENMGELNTSCQNYEAEQVFENIEHKEYDNGLDSRINYKVPAVVQENLRNLLKKFPDGLLLWTLPKEYKNEYKENIEYNKYGYSTLVQFCCSLDYILKYKQMGMGGGKLYDANSNIPEDNEKEDELLDVPTLPTLKIPLIEPERPRMVHIDFVMLPGDTVTLEILPPINEELVYIELLIAEVYDLSKFWFNLANNEDYVLDYYKNIQFFYDENYKQYEISFEQLQEGLYVVVYNAPNDYRRAKVVKFNTSMVLVFCIDEGTVLETNIANIYLMHRKFSAMPRQGIRGRLARLVPPMKDAQWSRNSAYRFLELTKNRLIHGSVASIDDTQGDLIYELVLCDASHEADVFIQSVLIADGFAIEQDEEQLVDGTMYLEYEPTVTNLHLYPTFAELEWAELPTSTEMRHLESFGMPLYEIYPNYFKRKQHTTKNDSKNHIMKTAVIDKLPTTIHLESKTVVNKRNILQNGDFNQNNFDMPIESSGDPCLFAGQSNSSSNLSNDYSELSVLAPPPGFKPKMMLPSNQYATVSNPNSMMTPPPSSGYIYNKNEQLQNNYMSSVLSTESFSSTPFHDRQSHVAQGLNECPNFGFRDQNHCNASFANNIPQVSQNQQLQYYQQQRFAELYRLFLQSLTTRYYLPPQGLDHFSTNNNMNVSYNTIAAGIRHGNITPNLKKYVVTANIWGKTIHIVRILSTPCIVIWKIQETFTGRKDPVLLRRVLQLAKVELYELMLDSINVRFLNDLASNNLIPDGNTRSIEYVRFKDFQELLSCILHVDCNIPNFEAAVTQFSDESSIWSFVN